MTNVVLVTRVKLPLCKQRNDYTSKFANPFIVILNAVLGTTFCRKKNKETFRNNEKGVSAKSGWKIRPPLHSTNFFSESNDYSAPNNSRKNNEKEEKGERKSIEGLKKEKKKEIHAKHDRERTKKSVDQCQLGKSCRDDPTSPFVLIIADK